MSDNREEILKTDFFHNLDSLRAKYNRYSQAVILGSGPNALKGIRQIPDDALLITLNKAILMGGVRDADVWIALASQYPGCTWWTGAVKKKKKMRATAFYSNSLIRRGNQRGVEISMNYRYSVKPALTVSSFEPLEGRLRTGATVAAVALQWCYWLGIDDILLCGIDMSGKAYYDGKPVIRKQGGDPWPWRTIVDKMIRWMIDNGSTVRTLSPTKLKVGGLNA